MIDTYLGAQNRDIDGLETQATEGIPPEKFLNVMNSSKHLIAPRSAMNITMLALIFQGMAAIEVIFLSQYTYRATTLFINFNQEIDQQVLMSALPGVISKISLKTKENSVLR